MHVIDHIKNTIFQQHEYDTGACYQYTSRYVSVHLLAITLAHWQRTLLCHYTSFFPQLPRIPLFLTKKINSTCTLKVYPCEGKFLSRTSLFFLWVPDPRESFSLLSVSLSLAARSVQWVIICTFSLQFKCDLHYVYDICRPNDLTGPGMWRASKRTNTENVQNESTIHSRFFAISVSITLEGSLRFCWHARDQCALLKSACKYIARHLDSVMTRCVNIEPDNFGLITSLAAAAVVVVWHLLFACEPKRHVVKRSNAHGSTHFLFKCIVCHTQTHASMVHSPLAKHAPRRNPTDTNFEQQQSFCTIQVEKLITQRQRLQQHVQDDAVCSAWCFLIGCCVVCIVLAVLPKHCMTPGRILRLKSA